MEVEPAFPLIFADESWKPFRTDVDGGGGGGAPAPGLSGGRGGLGPLLGLSIPLLDGN